jgi:hypothetical protein
MLLLLACQLLLLLLAPAAAHLIKSPMMLLLCPSWLMLKVPSLLSFITAGMEGKITHASRLARTGFTASTICDNSQQQQQQQHRVDERLPRQVLLTVVRICCCGNANAQLCAALCSSGFCHCLLV